MESDEKKVMQKLHEEDENAMTQEEKFLTQSYAAMMLEMAREEEYDFEENEDDLSDGELEAI